METGRGRRSRGAFVSLRPSAFIFASTWKSNWPAAVGVPEIRPVFASSASAGRKRSRVDRPGLRIGHRRCHLQRVRRAHRAGSRRLGPDRELGEPRVDVDDEAIVRGVLERAGRLFVVLDREEEVVHSCLCRCATDDALDWRCTVRAGSSRLVRWNVAHWKSSSATAVGRHEVDRDGVRHACRCRSGRWPDPRPRSPSSARRSCRQAPTTRGPGTSRPRRPRERGGASVPPAGQGSRPVRRGQGLLGHCQGRRARRRRRVSRRLRTRPSPRSCARSPSAVSSTLEHAEATTNAAARGHRGREAHAVRPVVHGHSAAALGQDLVEHAARTARA